MNIALLTAAGIGSRMHQDVPKQFLNVDNRPIIIHTLERFEAHPSIDAIIVVTLEAWIDVLWAYAKQFEISKLKWVVPGGATGQESISLGLDELSRFCSEDDMVMIHDGNRPFISSEIISDSIAKFNNFGSAVAAIPCVEAVLRSSDGVSSSTSVSREELWRTQTPHAYTLGKLLWAHEEAAKRNITNTAATCVLMQELGEKVYFSKGSETNLKITTVDDLNIFQALLHTQQDDWVKRDE